MKDWFSGNRQGEGVILSGTPSDDELFGGYHHDVFVASKGNDLLGGGKGIDTVVYGGDRESFNIKLSADGAITVIKPDGIDKLVEIERLAFSDGFLLFDIDSINAPTAYRLYGGAFDRTPDEGGLLFWVDYLDNGGTLYDAAIDFVGSAEFVSLYGAGLSDAEFINQLYLNVLGRPGEEAGAEYWNSYLAQGGDRAAALVNFTQLDEYVGLSLGNIENGYWVS